MTIVTISNGDTSEWVRLDFSYGDVSQAIISVMKLTLAGDVKRFDFRKKCWYVHTDVIETLILGIRALGNSLGNIDIKDTRIKEEDFDSFFNNAHEVRQGSAPLDKKTLLKELEYICKDQALVMISIREDAKISDLKPYYRKAALALHPDRNNGDGAKMSHLNMIWAQLQQLG